MARRSCEVVQHGSKRLVRKVVRDGLRAIWTILCGTVEEKEYYSFRGSQIIIVAGVL